MTYILGAIATGLGATLVLDAWALLLRRCFNIASLNYCLLGRWLRYFPEGTFTHTSIAAAPHKRFECSVGWVAHYLIGVSFALAFVLLAGSRWLQRPTLMPALLFGIVTVAVPFLIMQPCFGLGVAASKTANPSQARLRSLMTHAVFGVGLYFSALAVSYVLRHNV